MTRRIIAGAFLSIAALLWTYTVRAQEPTTAEICFYRNGQPAPATRDVDLSGMTQSDAALLLLELLEGPTSDEQAAGLTSPLPPGTELIAVTVSGDQVVVDLLIPLDFLETEIDPYITDAIVEQIVRALEPLGLLHFQVRAADEHGDMVPVSSFLRIPPLPEPITPDNDEPLPASPAPVSRYAGQPPAFGQGQPQGALNGTTAWLSAGHGWYWDGSKWTTQRFNYNDTGIVEDLANAEAVNYYLARYLWNAGASTWLVRDWGMNEHEIIVDNEDGAPGYSTTGAWATSTTPGYDGGTYQWTSTYDTRTATATWTPDLPEAGWYPVWVWYRHYPNRPFDARYEIHHAGGMTPISISQEVHGMTWRYLGEFYFEAGTAGHVTLINQSDEYDPSQAVIADAMRFGGGPGSIEESGTTSNQPRWEEAAKYWAMYQGAPEEVYTDDDGDTNDVIARPRYAEWEAAKGYPGEGENSVFISWHTNGFDGTITGTESYIHSTEPTTGSVALQDWVHAELISDLRAAWDPAWVNRGQKSADFGELRELSTMPGVLLEIAFHDSTSDADALREPKFRQIAARAVYQGIVKYQAQRLGVPVHLLPEPPERLTARNTGPGEVTLTWAPSPCCNGVVGDAATAHKVYHSTNGRGFDNGVVTSDTSLAVSGLPAGSIHFFRVTALNDGGESFPTPVVAVRTPVTGQAVEFLIIDGFDRLDQTAMIPQWESNTLGTVQRMFLERMNRFDYAVEHGQALSACNRAFDGADNEAVEAGDMALAGYRAVDWFTGEDSVADASLSDVERGLLGDYLDGGGNLLISGAEIGYDLVEYNRDPAFFRDYLRAEYRGDDAGTYQFTGVAGSIFEGLAGSFDDSTFGTYDVGYPDRVAPLAGSASALTYAGGTGDGAAVSYDRDFGVVYVGFPLETVTDPSVRADLVCAAAEHLVPPVQPIEGVARIINPGFEQGLVQSAWQATASDDNPVFTTSASLPAYVQPHSGDWLACMGGLTPDLSATAALTQTVALPSGDPAATLSIATFVHPGGTTPHDDKLSVRVYDLTGTLQVELIALTGQSPADAWHIAQFDLSAFSGQTVQVVIGALTSGTAFFVDDVSLLTAGASGPDEFRALWVDAYRPGIKSRRQIDELVETAQAGNFNALIVQVRRRGDTYYPSEFDPWAPDADPSFDALAYLIERAHDAGIEVHAWATTLAIWGGDTPPAEPSHTFNVHGSGAFGRNYWLMTSNTGDEQADSLYWLDPGHPDVVEYTVAIYAELATRYDLDGLHLDRVRYAWQEWGYNPTSLARFLAQTERTDVPPPTDEQWLQWRRDQVTALVRKIYLTVTAIKPQLQVSAALSAAGWPPTDTYPWETRTPYTHQLQDWRAWLDEGILDLGLTMTYKDDDTYEVAFNNWITWQKEHQYGRGVAVGTGLYLNTVPDSMSQWLRVRQPSPLGYHALGISGYSYGTPSNDGTPRRSFINTAVTEVFTQTAHTPFLDWKDAPELGHLMGTLIQAFPCPGMSLDGYSLTLNGPTSRQMLSDGNGWFGAVDLPPGTYQLLIEDPSRNVTIQVPVEIAAGAVTEQSIVLPGCAPYRTYLPLILKQAMP
ncbi:MAG: family 10 glycosylhydrolase [Anaerolineae bacterium]|jgi:uncharacterized lipoprotein YddW (UPF0748 family)